MKLYQDQVLNHMWEFPDDATPEEMDGFVARHHAAAGEHLAKQGWGRELFHAAQGFAQPFVNQAAQGGGSTLAPYGASDVFGLGTQQVSQLQQNWQQDQVQQQKTAAEERAMLAQQAEQEKDRSLRLKVLQQKEKNDQIEAQLQSRQVAVSEKNANLAEKRDQRGDLITGPDGGMYQMNYDEAGNPVVGSTPVLQAPAQTVSMGGYIWERGPDGWRKAAGDGPVVRGGSAGAGAQEKPPAPYKWNLAEAEKTTEVVQEMLKGAGLPTNNARGIVAAAAERGESPHRIIYGVNQHIRDLAAKQAQETERWKGAEKRKLNGVTGWFFPATGEFQPDGEQ